jgi:hypothetical protein
MIENNTRSYLPSPDARTRLDDMYQPFLASVLTVDYERKVCTLRDDRSNLVYTEVRLFPANYSSGEATDVIMPEQGAVCLAVKVSNQSGFSMVAILNYMVTGGVLGIDAVANRSLESIPGWRERKRGTYRKAYPGQQATSLIGGYSQKVDEGWDRLSADFSRDKLDVNRRTKTAITSREVRYTDAGVEFVGPVNRPGATSVPTVMLPDGSTQQVVFLDPTHIPADRYNNGAPNVIAFSERTSRVQEFALDYAVPQEVIESSLIDTILGTTQVPWHQTTVSGSPIAFDNETILAQQEWDHPYSRTLRAVGPALQEGSTPARRGFVLETAQGTLVGFNRFDTTTYGKVLKPVVFPYTSNTAANGGGRFGSDVEASYLSITDDPSHVEARVAASAFSMRFPAEYNLTRLDVTKEGFTTFEIGSTLPKEINPFNSGAYKYEHPHGAGRSLEGNLVGSMKLVIGKNRDEEDSLDITALGQTILRFGADDTSLPNANHLCNAQQRMSQDAPGPATLQYWTAPKLQPNVDVVSLTNKVGGENISLRAALDGALVMRVGARPDQSQSLRRHMINGYSDGPGVNPYPISNSKGQPNSARIDSKSPGRPVYANPGDATYRFHDLTQAGSPKTGMGYYGWSGSPTTNMDQQGLSVDFHAVRDVLLRIGMDPNNNQSLLMDLAGGIVAWIGKDKKGRSITASLDGGVEMTIGQSAAGKGLRLEINGDVDWTVKGNFHMNVTGDTIWESTTHRHNVKTDMILAAQNIHLKAVAAISLEAIDLRSNQGLYVSSEVE